MKCMKILLYYHMTLDKLLELHYQMDTKNQMGKRHNYLLLMLNKYQTYTMMVLLIKCLSYDLE